LLAGVGEVPAHHPLALHRREPVERLVELAAAIAVELRLLHDCRQTRNEVDGRGGFKARRRCAHCTGLHRALLVATIRDPDPLLRANAASAVNGILHHRAPLGLEFAMAQTPGPLAAICVDSSVLALRWRVTRTNEHTR